MNVGDIVTLNPESSWATGAFSSGETNPLGINGQIIDIDEDDTLPIAVKWDNGNENSYEAEDLILVGV